MSTYTLVVHILTHIKNQKPTNAGMGVKRAKIKDTEQPGNETTMGDVGLVWKTRSNRASESRITDHSFTDGKDSLQDGGIYKGKHETVKFKQAKGSPFSPTF